MFAFGEKVLLIDAKKRRYLFTLKANGEFHTHAGFIAHELIINSTEGSSMQSTKGADYILLRPTLEDFVIQMPRGAQVIYPKDLAPICIMADISPGVKVFESGLGSGALSMTMLRYGAIITGYEIREDFANRAQTNVREFLGEAVLSRYSVSIRDAYLGIEETGFDRMVLDLPEPWHVITHAKTALRKGALVVSYSPSITQAVQTREAMGQDWLDLRTLEVLHRTWHIEGASVRPDHRMVAHTGFLTSARFIGA